MLIMFPWGFVNHCLAKDASQVNIQLAAEKFTEGKEIYENSNNDFSQMELAENKLMDALRYIPEDRQKICYHVKKMIWVTGAGPVPEQKNVEYDDCIAYYPKRLLGEIRSQRPPEPWATIEIIEKRNRIRLKIENKGQSRMENFRIIPSAGLEEKEINTIKPNEIESVNWILFDGEGSISFNFKEKYGFVPLPMILER